MQSYAATCGSVLAPEPVGRSGDAVMHRDILGKNGRFDGRIRAFALKLCEQTRGIT